MASVIPKLIRCPKCLEVLSEIPGVAVYKCGGCAAILRAQVDSSSGKTSSSASASSSSKNISDTGSLDNEKADSGSQDQVLKAKVSGVGGELNIRHEFSENGTKNSGKSEFDAGNLKGRRRSQEQNEVTEHNLNGNGKKFAQHAAGDDKMFQKIRNESSILLRSRSSHVNFPRKAISRFDFPGEQGVLFSSEDFRSALNFMGSENGTASESRPKDPNQSARIRHPLKIDQTKILRKVDELRFELRRYFDRGAPRRSASARFEGKFAPVQHLSSFIPPSDQPPASDPLQDDIFLHDKQSGRRPRDARSHLPAGGGAASSHSLHRDPHSADIGDKRSHEIKCYCRPVSGGAPFVICTRCRNLLQLPPDFLLSAKRVHKLRCGACSEVSSYTFRPKDRPAALPEARLPPVKDGKSLGEALDDEIAAAPRLTYITEGDPVVAYSDGSNPSFGKSSSTSHDSIVEEAHGRNSSLKSESSRGRRSQLHRLMGYSSARFLLFNAFSSSSEGSRTEHDR